MSTRFRITAALALPILLFSPKAHFAAVIAHDPFLSGNTPAAGEYAPSQALDGSGPNINPTVAGFDGPWDGTESATTSFIYSDAVGLDVPALGGEIGGSVRYRSTTGTNLTRDVQRPLVSPGITASTGETYWFSGLASVAGTLDPDFDGFILAGFMDGQPTDGNTRGYQFGFLGDGSEWDLVLRHRINNLAFLSAVLVDGVAVNETYHVLLRSEVNANGFREDLDVWLNPADLTDETSLGAPSYDAIGPAEDASLYGADASFTHLVVQGSNINNTSMTGIFDELTLGTTLADVAPAATTPVPEPSTTILATLTLFSICFCQAKRRHKR